MVVTEGVVCWSSASEAKSSSVATPVCPKVFNDFYGDCWPSESNDKSPDSPSSSVSAPASGTSGSESVAWKICLDMLAGSGCCVKAKHKAYNLYTIQSRRAGESLLCQAVWRISPLIIVNGDSKATRTVLPLISKKESV